MDMAACKPLSASYYRRRTKRHDWPARICWHEQAALDMAKKYAVLRLRTPKPEGGFLEAFEIGLADLGCWGDQYLDASGYPYPDEVHAFVHDWLNLSGDFKAAMRKVRQPAREHESRAVGAANDVERPPPKGQSTVPVASDE